MSPPESTDIRGGGLAGAKPKSNIYTVLLGVALAAILLATLMLWLEMGTYEYNVEVSRLGNVLSTVADAGRKIDIC